MAISFITGKPGGGKGLVAVQEVVNELVLGTRPIVTNLALKLQPWVTKDHKPRIGLIAYLHREFKGKDFDCLRRVFLLPDEEMKQFFLWRRPRLVDGVAPVLQRAVPRLELKGDESRVVAFDTTLGGDSGPHLYISDESWAFWGSRSWQKTGEGLLFYNAQHRKFGDDLFVVTQATKQIDPAVHRVAQDFWVVKNHGNLSIGPFRRPGYFTVSIYENPPTGAVMSPMSSKVFKLDAEGLAQCFDTSAGVGLAGRGVADLNKRKRGLPFWMLPCSLLLLALCAWYGLRGVAWGVGHELGKAPGRMQKAANSALVAVAPKAPSSVDPVVPVSVSQGNLASVNVRPPEPVADTNEIFCTGFVILGRTVSVFLSNGSTIDSGSGRISLVTAAWVTVDGVKLPVRTGNVSVPVPAYFEKKSTLSYAAEAPEKISVSDALVLQALASPSVVPSVQPSVVVTPSLGHGVPLPSISGVH